MRRDRLLAAASFVPLLVKAVDYALLGSYLPLLVFLLFFGLVAWGVRHGRRASRVTLRIWAVAMVLWGSTRLGLAVVLRLVDVGEAHPVNQVNAWYVLLSLAILALGIHLFRSAGRASTS